MNDPFAPDPVSDLKSTIRRVQDMIDETGQIMDYQAVQSEFIAAATALNALHRAVRISKLHLDREDATSRIREIDAEFKSLGLIGPQVAVDWC